MQTITTTISNSPLTVAAATIGVALVSLALMKPKKQALPEQETWESHVFPHGKVQAVAKGLWEVTGSNPRGPPRNMAIYRLPDKTLLIHSCIAVNDDVVSQILALGEPSIVIVPSSYHRMDVAVWKQKFPKCKVITTKKAAKSVEEKVKVEGFCEDILPTFGIKCIEPKGADKLDELVYDVPLEDGKRGPEHTNFFTRILGSLTDGVQPRISRIMRFLVITNKPAFKNFVASIASPEHEVVLIAHGNPVTRDVQQKLKVVAESV